MIRLRILICSLLMLTPWLVPAAAPAAPLSIVKTSRTVSDPLGDVLPYAIPGAIMEYSVTITNPAANGLTTVGGIAFSDVIPAGTELRIADIGLPASGPIAINDGLLGLLGSGLTYRYSGLASETDLLDFSADNGAHWDYHPTETSAGFDSRVTNIRIRFTGSQTANSAFAIVFRVRVK